MLERNGEPAINADASTFIRVHSFLTRLKKCAGRIDRQTQRTLRGQALSGDVEGAEKGLAKLMHGRWENAKHKAD